MHFTTDYSTFEIIYDFNHLTTLDFTTTLSSFTDGLIPSVTTMKSVGENNTDGLTDGTRPSV